MLPAMGATRRESRDRERLVTSGRLQHAQAQLRWRWPAREAIRAASPFISDTLTEQLPMGPVLSLATVTCGRSWQLSLPLYEVLTSAGSQTDGAWRALSIACGSEAVKLIFSSH